MKKPQWYKGNIHTHTTSMEATDGDGDAEPEKVVSWYRRHGYDFLVLSDHNHLTLLNYGARKSRFKRPLMIPGEEISANIQSGTIPIHINGIGISRLIEPIDTGQIVSTIQANVDAVHQAGGISSINHPNYKWAFDHTHLNKVKDLDLLEIFNGHPLVNVYGGPDKYSYDQIWDGVLSEGSMVFGVATDDAHNYHDFVPEKSNPGRGWIVVKAIDLTQNAILSALEAGEFYASTGVTLTKIEATPEKIRIEVEPEPFKLYSTKFIGKNGRLLLQTPGGSAEYSPSGEEGYVRTVTVSSGNTKAWTQPVFLGN